MLTIGAVTVGGLIALALIIRLARSSAFKQSYNQTYDASRRVPRVTPAQRAAKELLAMVNDMHKGADIAPFYRRLKDLTGAGAFGRSITMECVEGTMTDPKKLVDIVRTLKQIAH